MYHFLDTYTLQFKKISVKVIEDAQKHSQTIKKWDRIY